MKLNFIKNIKPAITKAGSKAAFAIKKASPQISLIGGVTLIIGGGVAACFATRKIDSIIDEHKRVIEIIHKTKEDPEMANQYSEQDANRDITITYAKTVGHFIKIYAPAFLLCAAGICCVGYSHITMKNRISSLSAAYVGLNETFNKYRKDVEEKYGPEIEKNIRNGVKTETIAEEITDENGKKKKIKKEVLSEPNLSEGDIARVWDPKYTCEYTPDPEISISKLQCEQEYFNTLLRVRGYVFLNEVYHRLGYDETLMGQQFGWVYDKNSNNSDNYIVFINDVTKYLKGEEKLVLDFNVDGYILDRDPFHEAYAKQNK